MNVAVIGAAGGCGRQLAVQLLDRHILPQSARLQLVGHRGGRSEDELGGLLSDLEDAFGDSAPTIELVVDPRLDAKSATAWYLAARPDIIDTIEYSYLDGFPGPVVEVENGWDIDATEIKCRLDFGCGVLDWRGLYKNAGA